MIIFFLVINQKINEFSKKKKKTNNSYNDGV